MEGIDFKPRKNISFLDYVSSFFKVYSMRVNSFLLYKKRFRNFLHVARNVRNGSFPIDGILRNGNKITLSSEIEASMVARGLDEEYQFKEDSLTFKQNDFPTIMLDGISCGDIIETFWGRYYDQLNVCDRDVVDIGANIGSTAIYFVLRGANRVISVEPFPKNYQIAKRNVTSNNLENKITLLMKSCSNTPKHINPELSGHGISLLNNNDSSMLVENITLKEILLQYGLENPVLKMDCEGCEYEAILETPDEVLNKFGQILLEYHLGYKNIKKKLEDCGFHVIVEKPLRFVSPNNKDEFYFGYLNAIRN